ncbi:ABC transporter permease subunit [Clostridium sp. MCC353]|uniref:ABC transporter permease n=1 Tax=Clostridium sp. MCC353 TaxID=2592646 RepID=UPI001C031A42|nr:ABC transporter permease [Clostridium sp. MCC353]MBT9777348.1 ABC transporter permease subunit [Clostridium sp. MCC353]
MLRYIGKRLLWMIPIVLGVTILVFTMMTFCPGDPAEIILGTTATEADLVAKRIELGLDKPFVVRLATYMSDVFIHFDFGKSWITNVDIISTIMDRMPRTLTLTVVTLLVAFGLGIPLGIMAATHQNRWQDHVSMVLALIGVAIPNFWLALLLVLLFSVKLGWLPAMGIGTGIAGLKYYILPAIANCAGALANCARQTRSSMLDVIRADYITTARSKGVPENAVIVKHALKNALIPIITMMGTAFGRLLGGAMIIETIFSIPGMGTYIIGAVNNRDYPIVQGGTIILAISFSLMMLLIDLLYAAVDPRIKAQYSTVKKGKKVKK